MEYNIIVGNTQVMNFLELIYLMEKEWEKVDRDNVPTYLLSSIITAMFSYFCKFVFVKFWIYPKNHCNLSLPKTQTII